MNPLTLVSAFFAGLLSFLSPCILPLIPAYISLIGGLSYTELKDNIKTNQAKIISRTLLFILGFGIVFTALGVLFSGSGMLAAGNWIPVISVVAGSITILLGLNIALGFLPFLNYEVRAHINKPAASGLSSFLMGLAFGAGWTPCVGPMLASILLLVSRAQSLTFGITALVLYSAGLALPFLLAAIFFEKTPTVFKAIQKHMKWLKIVSAVFLVLLGIFMISGSMQRLTVFFAKSSFDLNSFKMQHPLWTMLLEIAVLLAPAAIGGIRHIRKKTKPSLIFWILTGLSLVFIVLELVGVLSLTSILVYWFRFQGA